MTDPQKKDSAPGSDNHNDTTASNEYSSILEKNVTFDKKNGRCLLKIKQSLFPLEAIQYAAHHAADDINAMIDTDSSEEMIFVELFLKNKEQTDIVNLFWKYNEFLIGYTVYLEQSRRNKALREAFLKKALFHKAPEVPTDGKAE